MKKFTKNIFESLSEPCYGLLVVLAGNRWEPLKHHLSY